jgi:hypothetical protein
MAQAIKVQAALVVQVLSLSVTLALNEEPVAQ